jgi:hypothetical protein
MDHRTAARAAGAGIIPIFRYFCIDMEVSIDFYAKIQLFYARQFSSDLDSENYFQKS